MESSSRSFAENLNTFLTEGWSWGDSPQAAAAFEAEPSIGKANIYAACIATDHETVRELLAKDPGLATRNGGPKKWPPILYATWSWRLAEHEEDAIQVIRLLLDNGANPNAFWRSGGWNGTKESALYGCVDANCDRAARVMLEAGADPNDGESLYHACEKENLAMLEALGDHGLNERDVSYCIKHAMDFRWDDGIDWFLEQGADPNAIHPEANETSLHWAVKRNCSIRAIRSLLDREADPNARTKRGVSAFLGIKGNTPLDFALRLGRSNVAHVLLDAGAVPTPQDAVGDFVIACANGERDAAQRMLDNDERLLSKIDNRDKVLVAHVAQMQSWDGVRLMVELGWKPDQRGGWMEGTPLHWAICYGNDAMVEFLLSSGANAMDDVGGYFSTPLNTVLRCRWQPGEHAMILRRLLDAEIEVPADWFPCGYEELDAVWREYRAERG